MSWRSNPHSYCPLCKSDRIGRLTKVFNDAHDLFAHIVDVTRIERLENDGAANFFRAMRNYINEESRRFGKYPNVGTFIYWISQQYARYEDRFAKSVLEQIQSILKFPGTLDDYLHAIVSNTTNQEDYQNPYGEHCQNCEWGRPFLHQITMENRRFISEERLRQKCPECNRHHVYPKDWEDISQAFFPSTMGEEERQIRWEMFCELSKNGVRSMIESSLTAADWFNDRGLPDWKLILDHNGNTRAWRESRTVDDFGNREIRRLGRCDISAKLTPFNLSEYDAKNIINFDLEKYQKHSRTHNAIWILGFPPGSLRFTRAAITKKNGFELYGSYNLSNAMASYYTAPYGKEESYCELFGDLSGLEGNLFAGVRRNIFELKAQKPASIAEMELV